MANQGPGNDYVGSVAGSDYGAGIGPGLSGGFGRRSTAGSQQTAQPSNPGPKDSVKSRRYNYGPTKSKVYDPSKKQKRPKPVKKNAKGVAIKKK